MTPFADLLDQIVPVGDAWHLDVPPDWMQGRTLYGGISAALSLAAALRSQPHLPPLRSAQVAFVGPASASITLSAALLRRGKSSTFISTDLVSDGQVATRSVFCFGADRASRHRLAKFTIPHMPPPELCLQASPVDVAPAFTQHFDIRLAHGPALVSGAVDADLYLWIKPASRAVDPMMLLILAMADAPPPAAVAMFSEWAPFSTMTWMVDVLTTTPYSGDGWWLARSHVQAVADGYAVQEMMLWSSDGTPVLAGRQTVAIYN